MLMQALLGARAAELQDTQRLVQQLGMARQKLAAAEAEATAERCVVHARVLILVCMYYIVCTPLIYNPVGLSP